MSRRSSETKQSVKNSDDELSEDEFKDDTIDTIDDDKEEDCMIDTLVSDSDNDNSDSEEEEVVPKQVVNKALSKTKTTTSKPVKQTETKNDKTTTSKKSTTKQDNNVAIYDINTFKNKVVSITSKEFTTSIPYKVINYLINKCKIDKTKLVVRNVKTQKETSTDVIDDDKFKSRDFTSEFYKLFTEYNKITCAVRYIKNDYSNKNGIDYNHIKTTKDYVVKDGTKMLVKLTDDDIDVIKRYTKFVKQLWDSIDLTKIYTSVDDKGKKVLNMKSLKNFLLTKVFDSSNAYDMSSFDDGKLMDFPFFGFNIKDYNEISFQYNENYIIHEYKQLFSEDVIRNPFKVFNHRVGIVKDLKEDKISITKSKNGNTKNTTTVVKNERPIEDKLSEYYDEVLESMEDNNGIEGVIRELLSSESIKNIFIHGYKENKILQGIFTKLFMSKQFDELLINTKKLYKLSFLFSPYICSSVLLDTDMKNNKSKNKLLKMKLAGRHKTLVDHYLLDDDDVSTKRNNYWVYYLTDSEDDENNPWVYEENEEEKIEKIDKQKLTKSKRK